MPRRIPKSIPLWVEKVNESWSLKVPNEKPVIHLHEMVIGLFQAIKENNEYSRNRKILNKVNRLADKQLNYYKSSRFGFINEFFSSLHNLLTLGKFHSSAYLAKKISQELLDESMAKEHVKRKKREEAVKFKKEEFVEIEEEMIIPKAEPEKKEEEEIQDKSSPESQAQAKIEIREDQTLHQQGKDMNLNIERKEDPIAIVEPNVLTLKEQLFDSLNQLWEPEDSTYRDLSFKFWELLFKEAEIVRWEKKEINPSKYSIILSKPITGKIDAKLPFLKEIAVKVNQKVEFTLSENGNEKGFVFNIEKDAGLNGPLGMKLTRFIFHNPKKNSENLPDSYEVKMSFDGNIMLRKLAEGSFNISLILKYLNMIQWDPYKT